MSKGQYSRSIFSVLYIVKNIFNEEYKSHVLTTKHLTPRTQKLLQLKLLQPEEVTLQTFPQYIRIQFSEGELLGSVIFLHNKKKYLLIYNK